MPFRPVTQPGSTPARPYSPRARTRAPAPAQAPEPAPAPAPVPAPAQAPERGPAKRDSSTPANKRAHHKVDRTGANWDENGDYIVGKNRPPIATRWQKDQSGNPRGPAKRETLTAQAQFEQTFLAPFNATVNGETVPLTVLSEQRGSSSAVMLAAANEP